MLTPTFAQVYGAALVPVFDGLIMMKEQFASNKAVLLVRKCPVSTLSCSDSCN